MANCLFTWFEWTHQYFSKGHSFRCLWQQTILCFMGSFSRQVARKRWKYLPHCLRSAVKTLRYSAFVWGKSPGYQWRLYLAKSYIYNCSGNINISKQTSFSPVFCYRLYLVCDLCKYNRILYNSLCTGREELVLFQVFPLSQVSGIGSEHEVSSVHIWFPPVASHILCCW